MVDFAKGANGPDLIAPQNSPVYLDVNHTGTPDQIGWAGPNEGMLVYDHSGTGQINPSTDLSFLSNAPAATNNFQGLMALDSNDDGILNITDPAFSHLMIWRDTSTTGIPNKGQFQTLAQVGIRSIQLNPSNLQHGIVGDGGSNAILGVSSVTMTNGAVVKLYDVALGFADNRPLQQAQTGVGLNFQSPVTSSASSSSSDAKGTQVLANSPQGLASNVGGGVSMSQGRGNGPTDATVAATSTSADDNQWWAQATASQSLVNSVSSLPSNDNGVTVGGSAGAPSSSTPDAATLQQQALLVQSMASMPQASGGSAAVWNRSASSNSALQLATANSTISQSQALPLPVPMAGSYL